MKSEINNKVDSQSTTNENHESIPILDNTNNNLKNNEHYISSDKKDRRSIFRLEKIGNYRVFYFHKGEPYLMIGPNCK